MERGGSADRRDVPRPSLRLNLLLLAGAVVALFFAARERHEIDAGYVRVFSKTSSGSAELNQVKAELAEMSLTKEALDIEFDSRLAFLENKKSRYFFLSIDTEKKRIFMNFGNDTVRDADLQVGAPVEVAGPDGRTLTLPALKGAFSVVGKETDVENGLGKFVVLLPNDYVIHSPPAPGSARKGPKPGSFMVPETYLKAIWDRITPETRVYIF